MTPRNRWSWQHPALGGGASQDCSALRRPWDSRRGASANVARRIESASDAASYGALMLHVEVVSVGGLRVMGQPDQSPLVTTRNRSVDSFAIVPSWAGGELRQSRERHQAGRGSRGVAGLVANAPWLCVVSRCGCRCGGHPCGCAGERSFPDSRCCRGCDSRRWP
jgi:hypothetical protein